MNPEIPSEHSTRLALLARWVGGTVTAAGLAIGLKSAYGLRSGNEAISAQSLAWQELIGAGVALAGIALLYVSDHDAALRSEIRGDVCAAPLIPEQRNSVLNTPVNR